jgi:DNA-binding TFAR19-related protein (PDSD5 family)
MSKTIKKHITDKALALILNKLDKLTSKNEEKIEILNQSIEHSWQGGVPSKN